MNDFLNQVAQQFSGIAPDVDAWTLRLTSETNEAVSVRQGVMQPVYNHQATGALITVVIGDGSGYAATQKHGWLSSFFSVAWGQEYHDCPSFG